MPPMVRFVECMGMWVCVGDRACTHTKIYTPLPPPTHPKKQQHRDGAGLGRGEQRGGARAGVGAGVLERQDARGVPPCPPAAAPAGE